MRRGKGGRIKTDKENQNYYLSIKDKVMKRYEKNIIVFKKVLEAKLGGEAAEEILTETRVEYQDLIERIPFIGGDGNPFTGDLIDSTAGLAFSKAMRRHQYSDEDIVSTLFEVMREHFGSYPRHRRLLMRSLMSLLHAYPLNKLYRRYIRKMAERSQRGEFSDSLVLHYVEGDGEEFDYGIDYTACPMLSFWRDEGMGEVFPYVCLWDFYSSEMTGSGLVRTMTLSEGCEKCDFRFKRGRKPENRQRTQFDPSRIPSPSKRGRNVLTSQPLFQLESQSASSHRWRRRSAVPPDGPEPHAQKLRSL